MRGYIKCFPISLYFSCTPFHSLTSEQLYSSLWQPLLFISVPVPRSTSTTSRLIVQREPSSFVTFPFDAPPYNREEDTSGRRHFRERYEGCFCQATFFEGFESDAESCGSRFLEYAGRAVHLLRPTLRIMQVLKTRVDALAQNSLWDIYFNEDFPNHYSASVTLVAYHRLNVMDAALRCLAEFILKLLKFVDTDFQAFSLPRDALAKRGIC